MPFLHTRIARLWQWTRTFRLGRRAPASTQRNRPLARMLTYDAQVELLDAYRALRDGREADRCHPRMRPRRRHERRRDRPRLGEDARRPRGRQRRHQQLKSEAVYRLSMARVDSDRVDIPGLDIGGTR